MKRHFQYLILLLLLAGCWRTPTDVNFESDPRVLRGNWTGTLEKQCSQYIPQGVFSPDETKWFLLENQVFKLFDSNSGVMLATYTMKNLASPIVWTADSSGLIYLRKPQSQFQRVTINPLTGLETASIPLNSELTNVYGTFNRDLTKVAIFSISSITGIPRIFLYDLLTGDLIKSVVVPNLTSSYLNAILSPDGNQFIYSVSISNSGPLSQVWQVNLVTETITKVAQGVYSYPRLQLAGLNLLNISYTEYVHPINYTIVERIDLTTLQNNKITVGKSIYSSIFSNDGNQMGYIEDSIFYIKNLNDQAIVGQVALGSVNPLASGSLYGASNNSWLLSGANSGCTLRVFETIQQKFLTTAALEPANSQSVSFSFIPTYRDSGSYTLTATMQIGTTAARSISGVVSVPNSCTLFGGDCERLLKFTPVPNYSYIYDGIHSVQLEENGTRLEFETMLVGKQKNSQKAQFFGVKYLDGQSYVLTANPSVTP